MNKLTLLTITLLAAACGGVQKTGGTAKGGNVPPPPQIAKGGGAEITATGPQAPKVEISKDARKDYQEAIAFFTAQDKGTWAESSCRQAAEKFAGSGSTIGSGSRCPGAPKAPSTGSRSGITAPRPGAPSDSATQPEPARRRMDFRILRVSGGL